jgi:hypothetical protein
MCAAMHTSKLDGLYKIIISSIHYTRARASV